MEIIRIFQRDRYQIDKIRRIKWAGDILDCSDYSITSDVEKLADYFRNKHGLFSFIHESDDFILLASDVIGSKPLFYSFGENQIYISDDACLIAKKRGLQICHEALNEFYNACFTSYDRTLFQDIRQVLPGEFVIIYKNGNNHKMLKHKYYCLKYDESGNKTVSEAEAEFYSQLKEVFMDLVKRLNGRMAVLPLSGGLDSRTIAVMLNECGYRNVLCFSYGKKGNTEARISESVAKSLGYPWIFIEYNGAKWKAVFKSKEYKRFLIFSGRGRSAGCIQGLPAILELKNRNLIPEDSVVIPGHTLDVLAGSHLHLESGQFPVTKSEYLKNLVYMHYSSGRGLKMKEKEGKITDPLPDMIDRAAYLTLNQEFEYYNRQNKFVANDIRTYEFAGFECELPLWDVRICDFWKKVPFELLTDRILQKSFSEKYINPKCGIQRKIDDLNDRKPVSRNHDQSIKKKIKNMMKYIPVADKWGYIFYLAITGKYNNNGDWAAFWDMSRISFLFHCIKYGQMTVNGRAARDYISLVKRFLR